MGGILFRVFLAGAAGALLAEYAEPKIESALGSAASGDTAAKAVKYGVAGATTAVAYWGLSKIV